MNPFFPCPSCSCLVKRAETTCPFCGSAVAAPASFSSVRTRRLSRARQLGLGALTSSLACVACIAACNASDATLITDGGTPGDATLTAADASELADAAPDACAIVPDASFACEFTPTSCWHSDAGPSSTSCAVGAQVCHTFYSEDSISCPTQSATCLTIRDDVDALVGLGFDRTCLATCPTCACATKLPADNGSYNRVRCRDLPGGGVVLDSWHHAGACYGSPPACLPTS